MKEQNQIALDTLAVELGRKFSITNPTSFEVLKDDIKDAMYDALDYCNRDVLVGNMSSSVKDLYIFRRNTEGNEGETARAEGGVSQSFEIGIPAKIQSKLNRYRVAKVRSFR
ncbi:phage head-tail connector protein [Enterococcus casseliflavus]|uniref:phage head-tail connector protein n=1 Tax=Enterococcus casseliflavus TaxID=37734 RepID=UPI00115EA64C|nr:phage head-tail connector protein [Enterococcus casseliflavus]MDT2980400.1 phage head-tail connector protein [Enterococcus casseliflavus]MEB6212798.1 phage head-tail connector protein [Enterococcus casseliflavus]